MEQAQTLTVADGMVVSLDYVLTVDGQVFDSSEGMAPLEYVHGAGTIIPGLENALTGMAVGESKIVQVPAEEAYGPYDPNALASLDRGQFPPEYPIQVGSTLRVRNEHGQVFNARISGFDEREVYLDLNHPLAGKDLQFHARIAGVRPATEAEQATGRVGGSCSGCGSADSCSGGCG
ncbi:MAG TPA: peptidylprolyl isomerase [Anaerolineaceae bacterium]|nr:peptidylprolyl isomerase [Anaerolineaceae bacterium]